MQKIVIDAQNLSRSYKSYIKNEGLIGSLQSFFSRKNIIKKALEETSFQVESGQILGIVGANGAGKTTLLKLLSGLIVPTNGTVKVLNETPHLRKKNFLKKISILLGQKNQLWWDLSPLDSFQLLIAIYDLNKKESKDKIHNLAKILDTEDALKIQLRRLSLGERMKMELIGALLHNPDVIFLDEPTIGLDVLAQQKIRKFLKSYIKSTGSTILLTSHSMDDITELSDRLMVMSHGKIVYHGEVQEFQKKFELHEGEDFEKAVLYFLEKELLNRSSIT